MSPRGWGVLYGTPFEQAVLARNPAAFYRMKETAGATTLSDRSPNARNGLYGAPANTGYQAAGLVTTDPYSRSVTLDGTPNATGEYAESATDNALRALNMTVMAGYRGTGAGAATTRILWSDAVGNNWNINANVGATIVVRVGGTVYTTTANSSLITDGRPHLVCVVARAASVQLYIDGVSVWQSASRTNTTTQATMPWRLARSGAAGTTQYTYGDWSEWAMFTTDLSSADIAAIWSAWRGL